MIANARYMSTVRSSLDPIANWSNYFKNVMVYFGLTGTGNINDDCYKIHAYFCDVFSLSYEDMSVYDVMLQVYNHFFLTYSTPNQAPSLTDYLNDFYGNLKPLEYDIGDNTLWNWGANHTLYDEVSTSLGAATDILPDLCFDTPYWKHGFSANSKMYSQWAWTLPTVANFDALTIRAFIKVDANATFQIILAYGDLSSENGAFEMGLTNDEKPYIKAYSGDSEINTVGETVLTAGNFYQIKATVDAEELKIYVDDVEDGAEDIAGGLPYLESADGVFCGRDTTAQSGDDYPFLGSIYGAAIDAEVI